LEEKGLVAALEELASNAREVFKIHCQFVMEGLPVVVENEIALHLYYIVLEALANAAKHSGGSNVDISLQPSGDRWLLTIQDDGIGFSLPSPNQEGMGLRILHYRARVIGATLNLQSQPGSGTTVTCLFLPVSSELPSAGGLRRQQEETSQVEEIQP
jgi:signal transduction histidine kinase